MRGFLGLVVTLAILAGAYYAYRTYFGAKAGEACNDSSDCAALTGVQCLRDPSGSYCTPLCQTDRDCPTSWFCASAHDLDPTGSTQRVCSRAQGVVHAPGAAVSHPTPRAHH